MEKHDPAQYRLTSSAVLIQDTVIVLIIVYKFRWWIFLGNINASITYIDPDVETLACDTQVHIGFHSQYRIRRD